MSRRQKLTADELRYRRERREKGWACWQCGLAGTMGKVEDHKCPAARRA